MPPEILPDTIFAPASGGGKAGIAVYRISGPRAKDAIARLARPATLPEPRRAVLRWLHDPVTAAAIDRALLLWFPAPRSFTGEDIVEIHAHGGRSVAAALLSALRGIGFRLAEPGEFTRRAFENDRLDLTEAEAIADLVEAETEAQRLQALRQMGGALAKLYEEWRGRLLRLLAHMEAAIDFAEEDLPPDLITRQRDEIEDLSKAIARHLDDNRRGERLREGVSVAILGAPNAGKSSLLNALARRDAAIVSAIAGTTRDVIEAHLDLGGYPVILADTAGLRDGAEEIEAEGIRRALNRGADADIRLLVFDGALYPRLDAATMRLAAVDAVMVVNKADLLPTAERRGGQGPPPLFISARSGEGVPELLRKLTAMVAEKAGGFDAVAPTRARHRAALEDCLAHLRRALGADEAALQAEDLRLAMRSLGGITGRVGVEDLLDVIFRDFCIGK